MKCPHCGMELTREEVARMMRAIDSEARSEASRRNGAKGGRPRKDAKIISSLPSDETPEKAIGGAPRQAAQNTGKPEKTG